MVNWVAKTLLLGEDTMAEEAKEEVKVEAVAVKPGLKEKALDVAKVAKEKAKEGQVILKEKYDELSALCKILEAKCRAQAKILQERAEHSENLKKAGGFFARIKAYFAKVKIVPEKKMILTESGSLIYGYIESRSGNVIVAREACFFDGVTLDSSVMQACKTGDGLHSKSRIYGLPVFFDVVNVFDVTPEAALILERIKE